MIHWASSGKEGKSRYREARSDGTVLHYGLSFLRKCENHTFTVLDTVFPVKNIPALGALASPSRVGSGAIVCSHSSSDKPSTEMRSAWAIRKTPSMRAG